LRVRRLFCLAVAVVALASAVPAEACLPAAVVSTSTNHDGATISIVTDEQFKTNPAVTGGTGSADDPYRIENREVVVSTFYGIKIGPTTAHFLIRNVTVRDLRSPAERSGLCCFSGISIGGAQNGRIEEVRLERIQVGLGLSSAKNVTVRGAVIVDSPKGIVVTGGTNVTLSGNSLVNSSFVVSVFPPENASALHIGEDNTVNGLPIMYRSGCENGAEADRDFGAVFLFNCHDFSIRNSHLPAGVGAVEVRNSHDILFSGVRSPSFTAQRVDALSILGSEAQFVTLDDFTNVTLADGRTPAGSFTHVVARNGTGFLVNGNDLRGDSILAVGAPVEHWCSCLGPAPPTGVTRTVITNNTLSDGTDSAITLYDAAFAMVEDNRIINHTNGIEARDQRGLSIQRNHIEGPGVAGGRAVQATGEGVVIRANSISNTETGLDIGPAVEASGNQIAAEEAGMRLDYGGSPLSWGNEMFHGGVVPDPDTGEAFALGPNNTVNGLPIVLHKDCDGVQYDGAVLGQLFFVDCANVTIANLSFADISNPITLTRVGGFDIEHLVTDGAKTPLYLRDSWDGRVANSTLNSDRGVLAYDVFNVTFVGNQMNGSTGALTIRWSGAIDLSDNDFTGSLYGAVYLERAWSVAMHRNHLAAGGLQLWGDEAAHFASHEIDETNTVMGRPIVYVANQAGPLLEGREIGELVVANCTGATLRNLRLTGAEPPLVLAFSSDVQLENVTAFGEYEALNAFEVEGMAVERGNFSALANTDASYGVTFNVQGGGDLSLSNTTVAGGDAYGLYVSDAQNVSIHRSAIDGGYFGTMVSGMRSLVATDSSFEGIYALYTSAAEEVSIRNSSFTGGAGLVLGGTAEILVEGNRFANLSVAGITVRDSSNVSIRANIIEGGGEGIEIGSRTMNVTVSENTISGNQVGINVETARPGATRGDGPVWIVNNTVERNGVGIRGNASVRVTVYHNRFINNTVQASVTPGGLYDAGYLIGGNYWSDYQGKDECTGYAQDICTGPDLYGDTPYCLGAMGVSAESVDHYPLMGPTAPPARNPPPPPPQTLAPAPTGFSVTWLLAVMAVAAAGAAALALIHHRGKARTDAEAAEAEISAQADGPNH
jgi:parallel beta-helix repeat protein